MLSKKKESEDLDEKGSNPLVQLTKIDPEEIPDVPQNKFLERNVEKTDNGEETRNKERYR